MDIAAQVTLGQSRGSLMARTIAIWVFGLLASAIAGGLVASRLTPQYSDDTVWGMFGILGGMFAFACIRLWLAHPRKIQGEESPTVLCWRG
jgi:hypothetical protein